MGFLMALNILRVSSTTEPPQGSTDQAYPSVSGQWGKEGHLALQSESGLEFKNNQSRLIGPTMPQTQRQKKERKKKFIQWHSAQRSAEKQLAMDGSQITYARVWFETVDYRKTAKCKHALKGKNNIDVLGDQTIGQQGK